MVAEWGSSRLSLFNTDGVLLRHLGDTPLGGECLYLPRGVVVDIDGIIGVADTGNGRVIFLSIEGKPLPLWWSLL